MTRAALRLPEGGIPADFAARIADVVRSGGTILYPTDTIYGLGCDAFNAGAVERIMEIKRRPVNSPMLILVDSRAMVKRFARTISPLAGRLMERFWPGPLTLIFDAAPEGLSPHVVSADGGVAIRLPDHLLCREVIRLAASPLVSTSANLSGGPVIGDLDELRRLFLQEVDLFIDAGPLRSPAPSSVVDTREGKAKIVREGSIPAASLLPLLGDSP